jgi:hypothetical protein
MFSDDSNIRQLFISFRTKHSVKPFASTLTKNNHGKEMQLKRGSPIIELTQPALSRKELWRFIENMMGL